jgi:hypothetical protein
MKVNQEKDVFFCIVIKLLYLDLLRSFQANFEFHHTVTKENTVEERNEVKPFGKINIHWTVSNTNNISHFILQWHSSKDLRVQQKNFNKNETSFTIGKYFFINLNF